MRERVCVCVEVSIDNVEGCFCGLYRIWLCFFLLRACIHIFITKNCKEANVKPVFLI